MSIFASGCNVPRAAPEGGKKPESQAADQDIIAFAKRVGFEPDQRQADVLLSNAKRGILNCSRQWGKSTVSAVKAVHRAYTKPGSLVLVASPTARQSAEWMRKAEGLVRRLDVEVRGDGHNEISLAFPNGSRIVGLPGTRTDGGVRGFSAVSLLIIDEAARVEEAMYKALRPMRVRAVGEGTALFAVGWRPTMADEHAVRQARVLLRELGIGRGRSRRAGCGIGCGWRRRSVPGLGAISWRKNAARWGRRGSRRNISAAFWITARACSGGICWKGRWWMALSR